MNNRELLKACLEKLELYHQHVQGEYPGGMPNMVLLPALRKAISEPRWSDGDFLDAALAAATGSILSPYAADRIRAYAREMREKQSPALFKDAQLGAQLNEDGSVTPRRSASSSGDLKRDGN